MNLYELGVGFRYLKSKKNMGFISFNTFLSMFIVFMGVFVLIIVTSVMNGFQAQIKDKILDVDSHFTVNGFNGEDSDDGITSYNEVKNTILSNKNVLSASPFYQGLGVLRYGSKITPLMLRGMGDGQNVPDDFKKYIIDGETSFTEDKGIFIGEQMSYNEGINIGDTVEVIVPRGKYTKAEGIVPGVGKFKVLGLFKTGYYEFDTKIVVMSLPAAQKIFAVGDRVWGIGVKVKDIYDVDKVAKQVGTTLGESFKTTTAEQKNENLFYALKMEKMIMLIILFLVIISAGFTIMGTLVMVVMEKRKAVGILKTIGSVPFSIMIIFILEGFFIGVIGAVGGILAGLVTALNLTKVLLTVQDYINMSMSALFDYFNLGTFNEVMLVPTNVYYIDTVPVQISPEFVVFIGIFAVFLATVSAIFPAWQAARLKPVESMRYE